MDTNSESFRERVNTNLENSFTKGNEENKVSVLRTSFAAFVTFCSENSLCLLVSIRGYINCVLITLPYSLIIEATEEPLGVRHFLRTSAAFDSRTPVVAFPNRS